jgi:hypothetical protein
MQMDNRVILAGVSPDIGRSMAQGLETGRLANTVRRENALAQLYQEQGPGIMAGDPNALNALAGIDPMAGLGVQGARLGMDERRLGMDATRQNMRISEEKLRMAYAETEARAAQAAAQMSAEQRAAEAAKLERGLSALAGAQSPEQWDAFAAANQPELVGQFENREMLFAQALGLKAALERQAQQGPQGGEFGLSPQYGVDAEGNPVLLQLGKDGRAVQSQMPEGVTLSREPIRLDAGTHFVLLDPITRAPIAQIPKALREAEAEKAIGRAEGEATGGAITEQGSATAKAQQALDLINSIARDPALDSITGMIQGRLPPMSQAGTDLNVRIEQLQGQVFLEAFQMLKGGGAITNVEGEKAERAMARLARPQSGPAYRAGLAELAEVIESGMRRMQNRAASAGQGQQPPAQAPAAPQGPAGNAGGVNWRIVE